LLAARLAQIRLTTVFELTEFAEVVGLTRLA
jgi:hypothetical protein